MYRSFFVSMLPGVEMDYDPEIQLKIFSRISDYERDMAIGDLRLSSPDHYRYYFAFAPPSHALSQSDVDRFWFASDQSAEAVADVLVDWHGVIVANGMSKADVLFERLTGLKFSEKSSQELANLLVGLSNCMDQIFQIRPIKGFEFLSLWGRVERLIQQLIQRLDDEVRAETVGVMFAEGNAIGWLTDLIRRETFAHGKYGAKPKPEEKWYFSADEFAEASSSMLKRYRQLSVDELKTIPRPLSLLFAWNQLGDAQGPKSLLAEKSGSEEGIIEVLELLSNTIATSSGDANSLKVENVAPFLNYEDAMSRLNIIAENEGELGMRARLLKGYVEA